MIFPEIIAAPNFEGNVRLNTYRAMALLGAIVLPLWGWLQHSSGANVNEPLPFRGFLAAFCAAFLVGSLFSRVFVKYIHAIAIALYLFLTVFAGILVLANDFSMITSMGMLLVFVVVAAILYSPWELILYAGGHLTFASIAPHFVEQPEVTPWLYFLSTVTVIAFSVAVHVGRLRNQYHRREAEEALQQVLNSLESDVAARTRDLQVSNELLLQEIDSRCRAEKFLHARGRVLEGLTRGGSQNELLRQVLGVIEEVNEGMLPSIMLLDESGSHLSPAMGPSLPDYFLEALNGLPVGSESGLCGAAAHFRRPMFSSDILEESSCLSIRPVLERAGLRGCCSVPLLDSAGQALGTLAVYYRTPRIPDAIDMEFIKSSAHYVAAAIERNRTEEALEQSQVRYRLATEAARLGVWDLNLDTMEFYVDPILKEILGYQNVPDHDVNFKSLLTILPGKSRKTILKSARRHLRRKTKSLAIEHRVRCRDGRIRWISARGAAIRDCNGRPVRVVGTSTDITEIKEAEQAVLESEAKFRSLSEAAFEGLLVLSGTEVLNANDKFREMFGWESGDIAGRDITEFVAAESAEKFCSCLRTLTCGVMEFIAVHRSGGSFPVEINASRYSQGGEELRVVAFRDLTVRQNLERMTLQLDSFVENASGPIFCVNAAGGVVEWNAAMTRLTGLERQRMLGQPMVDACVGPEDRDSVERILNRVRNGEAVANFEFSLLGAQGRRSRVLMNASAGPDHTNASTTVWCVGQDITELNEYRSGLEQKVVERTSDLLGALEKEKEIGDLRSRFVSMASHEFRTPLSTIQTTADLLMDYSDRLDREKSVEYLDSILSEVVHMTELLDDILIFGQGDAGKLFFRPGSTDVIALCEELIEKYERIPGNEDRIHWSCDAMDRPTLDEKMVRLILSNLISNALKYSPPDAPIEVRVRSDERGTVIEVSDHGIGVAEEDQAELFLPFHRGGNVGNRSGTGLGLAIIKMAVEMHRGTIELDSHENRGTRISVHLPHAREKMPAIAEVVAI